MTMKTVTLDAAIDAVKRKKIDEALNAGCVSVREVGAYLGIEKSRAYRLLKQFRYEQETQWKPKARRRRTGTR